MATQAPNILLILVDQLAPQALPTYGHPLVQAPHLRRLGEEGIVFDNAYCNVPICAPSHAALYSGKLPSRIGVYDNGAEFPASLPSFVHYLRILGYYTCVSGKMHFTGPDQLHGYEDRLTTDTCRADFYYTPNWPLEDTYMGQYDTSLGKPAEVSEEDRSTIFECSGGGADEILFAGLYTRSSGMDYDDDAVFQTVRRIYDYARDNETRPFCLTVSMIHPHDPYMASTEYWNRYDHNLIDLPTVGLIPIEERDEFSRRQHYITGMHELELTEEHIRTVRHAYYGMISYVDDKVGMLIQALEATRLLENTIVIFASDHGEMLGERGMFKKMSFFEWSIRVPLIVYSPHRFAPRRISQNVSLMELFPSILDMATGEHPLDLIEPVDGSSFLNLLNGNSDDWHNTILAEYTDVGAGRPWFMVKQGHHKLITDNLRMRMLFNLREDPNELVDRAGDPDYSSIEDKLAAVVSKEWSAADLTHDVLSSQKRRKMIMKSLENGMGLNWDFSPVANARWQGVRDSHSYQMICERNRRLRPER